MTVEGLPTAEAIDASLAELAKPYREMLAQLEGELRTAESVVRLLRENRNKVRTALRAIDPTYEPDSKPGPKPPGKGKQGSTVASATATGEAAEVLAQLKAAGDLNGGPFTASDLARRDDWKWSQSYSAMILNALHERGVVRLDHVGGPTGNAKLYVLV